MNNKQHGIGTPERNLQEEKMRIIINRLTKYKKNIINKND